MSASSILAEKWKRRGRLMLGTAKKISHAASCLSALRSLKLSRMASALDTLTFPQLSSILCKIYKHLETLIEEIV